MEEIKELIIAEIKKTAAIYKQEGIRSCFFSPYYFADKYNINVLQIDNILKELDFLKPEDSVHPFQTYKVTLYEI